MEVEPFGGFPHLFSVHAQAHSISQNVHSAVCYGSRVSSHSGSMDHGEGDVCWAPPAITGMLFSVCHVQLEDNKYPL